MIREILCFLGFHSYDYNNPDVFFLRDEGIKSYFRIDVKCKHCGKIRTEVWKTPKV